MANRREFLAAAGTAALAGCMQGDDEEGKESETGTSTPEPDFPRIKDVSGGKISIEWSQSLDDVGEDELPEVLFEIDTGSFDPGQLELVSKDNEPDNNREKTEERFKVPEEAEDKPVRLTADQLFKDEQEFYMQLKEETGTEIPDEGQQSFEVIKNVPSAYRADLRNPEGGNVNNWETVYSFDTHTFDRERIRKQRQKWNDELVHDELVKELDPDKKGNKSLWEEKYSVDLAPHRAEFANDLGRWDHDSFQQLQQAEDILDSASSAIRIYEEVHAEGEESATYESQLNDHFSSSLDKIVNSFHPAAENQKLIETTHVEEGNHGTVIAYIDTDREGIKGENNWYWVNTTSETLAPVKEWSGSSPKEGEYNPFLWGYKAGPETISSFSYETEKLMSERPLWGFVNRSSENLHIDPEKLSFSDNVLDFIYNDHVPNGDPAAPIIDMVEKAGDLQRQSGSHVQVLGDDMSYNPEEEVFEGYQLAINEGELYDKSMSPDQVVTEEAAQEHFKNSTKAA